MSDGFDVSVLEGKDRAELVAIAESLGEKVGARAKKADIVTLILKAVGADGGAPDSAADAGEAPSSAEAVPGGATEAAAADDGAGETEPTAEPTAESDDTADPSAGDKDGEGKGEAAANDASQGEGQQGEGQQGQQQGDGEGDGVESGNRRRRRRGRDRDRNRDENEQQQAEPVEVEGLVELRDEGYGFLRLHGYLPSRDDAYVSLRQTRQFGLRTGDVVKGKSRVANRNEKNPALLQVDEVNGHQAHNQPDRVRFEDLTPVFPAERLTLELADDPSNATARLIDLLAPIGKGARALVVAPPQSGTTTVLKQVVRSVEVNHPEVELLVVLIDERPEEITDMRRWLLRGSVASSAFDRPAEEHAAVADLVIERAKRLVEQGRDVVVVVDGITRLTRAHNLVTPASGRVLDGGIEPAALYAAKRFLGAARNAEEGGSLTIVATAAADTGSRADEVILEELRATANTELRLDRRLAERRTFPAVDAVASGTRHEESLVDRADLAKLAVLRRQLGVLRDDTGANAAGLEALLERVAATKTNADLLAKVADA